MIFGFNTDIKQGGTVYHVQSEAREGELLLQTQVFVRGRCIGKRATSYAERYAQPGFSEQVMHEMLKSQHRAVLDAIRDGKVEGLLGAQGSVEDIGGAGLGLELLKASHFDNDNTVLMRVKVTDSGAPVAGARINAQVEADLAAITEASSQDDGTAELKLMLDKPGIAQASILIHASYRGKSATRKFRLRKA
jgi:hypothetical protein